MQGPDPLFSNSVALQCRVVHQLKFEGLASRFRMCHTFSMIEQKLTNKARLIGYTVGALVVAAVVIVRLVMR